MSSIGPIPEWGQGNMRSVGDDQRELLWTPDETAPPGVRFTLSSNDETHWLSRDDEPSICGFHGFAAGHRSVGNGALNWVLSYSAIAREVDIADWLQAIVVSSDEVWLNRFEKCPGSGGGIAAWASNPRDGLLRLRVLSQNGTHLFLLCCSGSQSTSEGWREAALDAISGFRVLGAPSGTPCESVLTERFGPRDAWSFQRFASWSCSFADRSETMALSPLCSGLARLDSVIRGRTISLMRLAVWPEGYTGMELWRHHSAILRKQGFSVPGISFQKETQPRPWKARQSTTLTLSKDAREFVIDFHVLDHHSGSLVILGCGPSLGTSPEWWAIHRRAMALLLASSAPPSESESDRKIEKKTNRVSGGVSSLGGAASLGGASSLGRQTERPMEQTEPIKSAPVVPNADQTDRTSPAGMSAGGTRTAENGIPGGGASLPAGNEAGAAAVPKDSGDKSKDGGDKDKEAKVYLPPVAVILRTDNRSERGAKTFLVGAGTHLVFRCGSYDPDDRSDGSPTPNSITRRSWTLRNPDGSVRSFGGSPDAGNPSEITFTAMRIGAHKLRLEVEDDDPDFHRKGQTEVSITVVQKCPVPKIQIPLDFIPIIRRFNIAIPAVGDHIVAHSLSHDQDMPSGKGICEAKWRIEPDSAAIILSSDKDRITFVPEEKGLYKVFLRVINKDGVTSPEEAMVGQMISVPMNTENLAAYATDKIEELGFEAGEIGRAHV